jgi:hypothetical protein
MVRPCQSAFSADRAFDDYPSIFVIVSKLITFDLIKHCQGRGNVLCREAPEFPGDEAFTLDQTGIGSQVE